MRFLSAKALEYLLVHKIVATMRKCAYGFAGTKVEIFSRAGKVGVGVVSEVWENSYEARGEFFDISGFDSPGEWCREAKKLHGVYPSRLRYIVVVRLLNEGDKSPSCSLSFSTSEISTSSTPDKNYEATETKCSGQN